MKPSPLTITRHLVDQERRLPEATGEFTRLFWDLTIAFKVIARALNRAGLAEMLGMTGNHNVHGEKVQKLDEFAHQTIFKAMDHGGHLCLMASEEDPDVIQIPPRFAQGNYILLYDPLDGSSNIDVNASVGTVFSILKKKPGSRRPSLEDCLQPGTAQIAAGYAVYGSSTMLVYTTGQGVFGFTLDPSIGEFLLSHPEIRIPKNGRFYSVNEGNFHSWNRATQDYVSLLKKPPEGGTPYSLRYIGSLVSDLHRTLLTGGVFLYPAVSRSGSPPTAKLRLLYEANPLAMIVEQAGGRATTGRRRILEIVPDSLHQKTPLVIGSPDEVSLYEERMSDFERSGGKAEPATSSGVDRELKR